MPKEKSIGVSKDTLEMLKGYQKEFGFSSLDEAVKNSVQWAKLWDYVDAQTRRDMQSRINDLEFRISALETLVNKKGN